MDTAHRRPLERPPEVVSFVRLLWRRFVEWSGVSMWDKAWSRLAQDGRPLRCYRNRWIIEQAIARLHSFKRLVTRYEFYSFLRYSFPKLACMMIVLRRF